MDNRREKAVETLESDPNNPLAAQAKQVQLSEEFLKLMFRGIDPFSQDADVDKETFDKCQQILLNNPSLFIPQSSHELDREEYRSLTVRQGATYYKEAKKFLDMADVLKRVDKFVAFMNPLSNFNFDNGVKGTVGM